ncbi:hypothetical protein [Phormidium nigroviride]
MTIDSLKKPVSGALSVSPVKNGMLPRKLRSPQSNPNRLQPLP